MCRSAGSRSEGRRTSRLHVAKVWWPWSAPALTKGQNGHNHRSTCQWGSRSQKHPPQSPSVWWANLSAVSRHVCRTDADARPSNSSARDLKNVDRPSSEPSGVVLPAGIRSATVRSGGSMVAATRYACSRSARPCSSSCRASSTCLRVSAIRILFLSRFSTMRQGRQCAVCGPFRRRPKAAPQRLQGTVTVSVTLAAFFRPAWRWTLIRHGGQYNDTGFFGSRSNAVEHFWHTGLIADPLSRVNGDAKLSIN